MRHDDRGIVLSSRSRPSDLNKREHVVTAEVVSIPHLQFFEVILTEGAVVNQGQHIDIGGKFHPKVKSIGKKLSYGSLNRDSRKVLKAFKASEIRCRKLAEEIASSPRLISELDGPLEDCIKRSLGPSADNADQTTRKIARKAIMRFIESNLSGKPKDIHEMIIRGIYGPLAKEAEVRGLYYQH